VRIKKERKKEEPNQNQGDNQGDKSSDKQVGKPGNKQREKTWLEDTAAQDNDDNHNLELMKSDREQLDDWIFSTVK
jgi:hypothetical protein